MTKHRTPDTPPVPNPGSIPTQPQPDAGWSSVPPQPQPPAVTEPQAPDPTAESAKVRGSRFGGLWIGLIVAALVLVLLLVFIVQNSQSVRIDFFGWSGHLSVAVAILLGVAAGALLVALPGTVRILQLRRQVRKH